MNLTLEPPPAAQVETGLLIHASGSTTQGASRENNEDRYAIDPHQQFFIVADGVGGAQAGEVASTMAVRLLSARLRELCDRGGSHSEVVSRLRQCFLETSELIRAQRGTDRRLSRMGTTAAVALILDGRLYVAGLGDSRVYLLRDGRARQMTVDHTVAQALVEAGIVSAEQSRFHPYRSVLHKFCGCEEVAGGPCIEHEELQVGDSILLATDGLTDLLEPDGLADVVFGSATPQDACEALTRAAIDAGSTDDITCITVFVDPLAFEGRDETDFLAPAAADPLR